MSADVAAGVIGGPFAVRRGMQQDVAPGTLSEGGESGGKVDCESLSVHICEFPHNSSELPSWVGQENGEGASGLGGVGKCGLGPNRGFDDGAGMVLEVLAKFCFEFGGQRELPIGVVVDGDILESNSRLSFIRDEGKNIFPKGAEDSLLVLPYQGDSRIACKG
jgi:hypothetical protein